MFLAKLSENTKIFFFYISDYTCFIQNTFGFRGDEVHLVEQWGSYPKQVPFLAAKVIFWY